MARGEPFLPAIIQVLLQQLPSGAIKDLASREKVESHFKKLRDNLLIIHAVFEDAVENQWTQNTVKLWLESLRDLAYELEDLLDEFTTQASVHHHSRRNQQSRASMVWSSIIPKPSAKVSKMMPKIKEITNWLQFMVKQMAELDLKENSESPSNRSSLMWTPTTSLVNESQVYGRDEDKEAITKMLLMGEERNDGVSVIPIVGMGGIGKTTLAQLVYNDRDVEDCANLKSLPAKIRSMTSLVSLELRSCPRLDNFPKYDLPTNLSSLWIWDSKKFKPLAKWGLHRLTSLREFSICGGFKELEVLGHGNDLFPPSLIRFSIARFPKLTSLLEVLEKLASLRHLSIMNCANLNDLPSEGLLEKLWHLEISDCPLLKPKCMRDKGEYWPKISGIPCVEIDGTYIYKQSSV